MSWTLGVAPLGGGLLSSGGGSVAGPLDVVVEIAFDSGYTTAAASRTWTDVTAYVEAQEGISIQRGRQDQFSAPSPSTLTLTLNNTDGRFTPENASGAYHPNVKKGRPIRVRVSGVTRFLGYVDEWPVAWPGDTEKMSTVTITATSRQARIGRGSTLKSIVEEEILYDSPTLYFPLGEPDGSTTAGNIAPGRSDVLTTTQYGTGGTLAFGAGIGPGTDGLSTPVFTPASAGNALLLADDLITPLSAPGDSVLDFECFFVTSADGSLISIAYGNDLSQAGTNAILLGVVANKAAISASTGGTPASATGLPTVTDGLLHHVAGRVVLSGTTVTASIVVDGGSRVTGTPRTWPFVTPGAALFFPRFVRVLVGARGDGQSPLTGTIAHVAIKSGTSTVADTRYADHYNAGATGFAGESSGARIQRYARLAGIPTAEISTETGLSTSVAHKDTTGETPASLMQDVVTTEDGVVFDGKDGTLTFHARSHRYGATSDFTLSVAAGDVQGGLTPRLDDQNLTNDMTASRPNGITVRSTNDASIAEYGYYRESVEILTTSDNEVQSRADWEVNRFGTPRVSMPNLGVDLVTCSPSLQTSILAADLGTKFTATGLPAQAPASTMDFFIEGYTEQITDQAYGITLNVSSAAYANVWQLESATLGQLDSTTVLAY